MVSDMFIFYLPEEITIIFKVWALICKNIQAFIEEIL